MAVQAQYPSNSLFLNRSVQEQKNTEYSMQNQSGGGFLEQISHIPYQNHTGGANSRKRGRNSSSNQLIDQQQNVVSTGLRLSVSSQSSVVQSLLFDELGTQIKHQRDEIDQFLQSQGEQMRRTLAEKSHLHYRPLLEAAHVSAAKKLREKEVEAEKAVIRNGELEARAAQLSAEARVWQARARAQEITAASLQAQLQNAIMSRGERINENEEEGHVAEDAESGYIDPGRVYGPGCKSCRVRVASVVILPCRHLCVCIECDKILQTCPVCFSYRNSSVEVFL